ncbi:hypothetical protein S245_037541 [Arachis hypogaea]
MYIETICLFVSICMYGSHLSLSQLSHAHLPHATASGVHVFVASTTEQVTLPLLPVPPPLLMLLLDGCDEVSMHYQKHIRSFIDMFSFTSMAGKILYTINKGAPLPCLLSMARIIIPLGV